MSGALPPASGRWPFGPLMRAVIKERRLLAAGEKNPPLPAAKSRRSLMRGAQNGGNARFVFVQPHPVSITLNHAQSCPCRSRYPEVGKRLLSAAVSSREQRDRMHDFHVGTSRAHS